MPPFSSHRIINKGSFRIPQWEVTRWSSHSEATLQASLDDVDWDMFRASSSEISEFIRAAKRRYSGKIESHFQLNDSRRMWQGLKTICSSGNNSSAEVRADPLLAEELNTFYGRFECNGGATLPSSASGSSRQSSDHVFTGTRFGGK